MWHLRDSGYGHIGRILDETHLTKSFMLLELKTMPATNDMFVGRCGICGTVGNGHISRIRRRQGDKWLQMANAIPDCDDNDTIRMVMVTLIPKCLQWL